MIFTSGLGFPEGPVVLPDGSWLVVEMEAELGCVTQISPNGLTKRVIARTGRPNGLAVDKSGCIWVAESSQSVLLRISMDGKVETVATECDAKPFLWPNDLCFGPDGALYMTDSGVRVRDFKVGTGHRPDYETVKLDGRVYRIDPQSGQVRQLDGGLRFTNGIAFGPDETLYVNETMTGMIYRYKWRSEHDLGPRESFGNSNPDPTTGFQGPDGMAFGTDGRLYVAVFKRGRVTVLAPDGSIVEHIATHGQKPTNVAFGLPGDKRIYVTENELGALEVFDVGVEGLPLFNGEKRNAGGFP
jgi:gluconolactonase